MVQQCCFFLIVVDCGDPGVPQNGHRLGSFKFNSTVNFKCNIDHHLEGANQIKCLENGKWSAPIPKCLGMLLYRNVSWSTGYGVVLIAIWKRMDEWIFEIHLKFHELLGRLQFERFLKTHQRMF